MQYPCPGSNLLSYLQASAWLHIERYSCLDKYTTASPDSGFATLHDLPVELFTEMFKLCDYDRAIALALTSSYFWSMGKSALSSLVLQQS